MKHLFKVWSLAAVLGGLVLGSSASAQDQATLKLLSDGASDGIYGHVGQAGAIQIATVNGTTKLDFSLSGLTPASVYSVWLLLDTAKSPFVPGSCPNCVARDPDSGVQSNVYGFSPAAADNAGFTAGIGIDPNGFVADDDGNAQFTIELNYDIFQPASSPLVLRPGVAQNIGVMPMPDSCVVSPAPAPFPAAVDSGFMRAYNNAVVANLPGVSPAYQLVDGPLKPRLVRATVSGFEVAEHFDGLTHGHRPGLHIGNPAASSCGDWEGRLTGNLADAVHNQ
jgi:hypothetical protein